MIQVYVGIGSNIDRERHIRAASDELGQDFDPLCLSTVYESEAVGFEGPNFFNLVAGFSTHLGLFELVQHLRKIEYKYGRPAGPMLSGNRTLDLDPLIYGRCCGEIAGIVMPRPEITANAYVLCPLAEIAPLGMDPQSGKNYQLLWQEFDRRSQKLWPVDFNWAQTQKDPALRSAETELVFV